MNTNRDLIHQLEVTINSRYRLIFFNTAEEQRAETLLKLLADYMGLPFFNWTRSKGLVRNDNQNKGKIYNSEDLNIAIGHIEASSFPAIYHFEGMLNYLEDLNIVDKLKNTVLKLSKINGAIILTGNIDNIPEPLKIHSTILNMPEPSIDEYRDLLTHIIRDLKFKNNLEVDIKPEEKTQLLNNIKGLTLTEAEKILTKIMVVDNTLSNKDIRCVIEEKKDIIEKDGVLEYYPVEESMGDIAGLKALKDWLSKRKNIITDTGKAKEFGLEFPKGILVLGVPGCGKSLCAKAVAMEWGLPLLKFDTANLYNKYIGETEKNLKNAIETSEKMSPVILWIDEIEKAFTISGSGQDGGVSMRVFGTFLNWMQERKGDVFIFATANDVSKLPPEFLRKGRFDEIFFVDLPDLESRKIIFDIHLKKRDKDSQKFDLDLLATSSDGFSGSEIEQVVVSSLYTAFSESVELSTEILLNEISKTSPLSVTMAERIYNLREWAKERTVSAH